MTEAIAFSGTLGRAEVNEDVTTLRFYPFTYALDSDKPVPALRCEQPAFDLEALATIINNDECDIDVSADTIQLYSYFLGDERTLRARAISCSWQSYDIQDYQAQVAQLIKSERRTDSDLQREVSRNRNALALIEELTRRAEIKAQASDELNAAQDAVLKALVWVRKKLVEDVGDPKS